jgi:hypothetical protein
MSTVCPQSIDMNGAPVEKWWKSQFPMISKIFWRNDCVVQYEYSIEKNGNDTTAFLGGLFNFSSAGTI